MKKLLEIFLSFSKVGALAFGGGYSMLPILQREVIEKRGWVTEPEVMDYYAVGQCLPGIIAVNTSVFIGRKEAGLGGGIAAALGIVFPSWAIILIIASFIKNFISFTAVQNAFLGIRIAVAALILNALFKLWKAGIKDIFCFFIYLAAFFLSVITNISTVFLVLFAVASGILIQSMCREKAKK